jgi:hypothetical protein
VTIPDTPAGRNFSAMLNALNSRDRDVIAEHIAQYGRGEAVDDIVQCAERRRNDGRRGACGAPSGKPGDDLAPGTLNSILKQAGLRDR